MGTTPNAELVLSWWIQPLRDTLSQGQKRNFSFLTQGTGGLVTRENVSRCRQVPCILLCEHHTTPHLHRRQKNTEHAAGYFGCMQYGSPKLVSATISTISHRRMMLLRGATGSYLCVAPNTGDESQPVSAISQPAVDILVNSLGPLRRDKRPRDSGCSIQFRIAIR
ncbi:hypothetical protein BX600DRAFT_453409, partial [Xylariales sp. PMI_506]